MALIQSWCGITCSRTGGALLATARFQALGKSKVWLQRYAVTNSTAGQALNLELEQLSAIDIDPSLPSISQSLSLISQLVASER